MLISINKWFTLVFSGLLAILSCTLFSTALHADVEMMILIHHRGLNPQDELPEIYHALVTDRQAQNKGSGAFGHAWIWIHGLDYSGKYWDLELGHSAEINTQVPTYLEEMACRAQLSNDSSLAIEAVEVFSHDRSDGFLEIGHGGHIPEIGWSIVLSDVQLQQLLAWIRVDGYQFKRYNLVDHQCCHFVLQALQQVGVEVDVDSSICLPARFCLLGRQMRLHQGPGYRTISLLTPWALAQGLNSPQVGLKPSIREYLEAKHPQSPWPWVRLYERRGYFFQMIRGALRQIRGEVSAASCYIIEENQES